MKTVLIASVLVLAATAANAGSYGRIKGNDTGGIIPWSCEAEAVALDAAVEHCSSYGKYPRITSVHRQYGDYIAFNCLWAPSVNRYAIPAVGTRAICAYPRLRPVVKALD